MADLSDTICALSTAPGRAGIAIVRMSGPRCFEILHKIIKSSPAQEDAPDRRAVLGRVRDPRSGRDLDEALVTRFHAPHSYTGEDVAELSVHGNPLLISEILNVLCAGGARIAEPGEFTMRAFLRGRMDLAQAEAVRDVIEAQTLYQFVVAERQRTGEFSRRLEPIKKQLIDIVVALESALEFAEEELALESREILEEGLTNILDRLSSYVQSFRHGRIVREGFSIAVIGRPNVGKSSIFNALLKCERAIVAEIPGTTRDLISETADIEGIAVRLIDTAGLRRDGDPVEQMGVDRTHRIIAEVDGLLLVLDPSRPYCDEDERILQVVGDHACLVALNKSDLPGLWSPEKRGALHSRWPCIEVSALTGDNVEELGRRIRQQFFGNADAERDAILVTNVRHCRCLEEARQRITVGLKALREGMSEEFALADLHRGLRKLGEITGETSTEDILEEIFTRFCVGK